MQNGLNLGSQFHFNASIDLVTPDPVRSNIKRRKNIISYTKKQKTKHVAINLKNNDL